MFTLKPSSKQKKLISLQYQTLTDPLIKDECAVTGATESSIYEDAVIRRYLPDNDDISHAVVNHILQDNGIAKTCQTIAELLAADPSIVDDSFLDLLDYMISCETWNRTTITKETPELDHFVTNLKIFTAQIKKYDVAGLTFRSYDRKTWKHVAGEDLTLLDDLANVKEDPDYINGGTYFACVLMIIRTYWNLGEDSAVRGLKSCSYTYRIMRDICAMAAWPCDSAHRYELLRILKRLTFHGDANKYDASVPVLAKHVFLSMAGVITTDDAIVLHSRKDEKNDYTHAYRIIHGPGGKMTSHPIILLCCDNDMRDISAIAEKAVMENENARMEFPLHDICITQILYNGIYPDERIKWAMI